jgi:uncharacterized protein
MTWSPAHSAVEMEDLPKLRDLLGAGHDVEDDDGSGWTLLLHAIDIEVDSHDQGRLLHVDVTAFLLARGPTRCASATAFPQSRRPRRAGTGWPPR